MYVEDKASAHASVYHSKDFLRKMNIRTYMIMDALNLGYNVLHTDVDMTFLKNPLKVRREACIKLDRNKKLFN